MHFRSFTARSAFSSIFVFVALNASAQVTAHLDSTRMVVGEQARLTLSVSCDTSVRPVLPAFKEGDAIAAPLEVVRTLPADTAYDGARWRLTLPIVVTSFDTAHIVLPAFPIQVGGKTLATQRLKLEVYEYPVDTTHTEKYYPIKGIHEPTFLWDDWKWTVATAVLSLVLLLLSALFYRWRRKGLPDIRLLRRKPKLPPHEVALRDIETLKHEETLAADDSKAYYTRLTDILRTYIRDRYAFNALEMTSTEIIERLKQENEAEAIEELRSLFQTADLAKFAKYNALIGENDAHLLTAIDYVTRTKQEPDPNAKDETPRLTPDDRHTLLMKRVLAVLIVVCLTGAVACLAYDVYRIMILL